MKSKVRGALLIGTCLFLCLGQTRIAFPQVITGDIVGTVRDASGAVIPGAKVVLTQTNTGAERTATTDAAGDYFFNSLKPTVYSLTVSKQGFKTSTVRNIDLLVSQRPRVDVVLQVGPVSQKVTVSAKGVQLLETQTSGAGQVVTSHMLTQLPLANRDFLDEAALVPTVTLSSQSNYRVAGFWTGNSGLDISVAGMREQNVSFLLDGIETRNGRWGSENILPSVDALQEFKVDTSAYSAEYGRSSAVVINTLKAGGNLFHGDAYEFVQNSSLDANNFFRNEVGLPIPPYAQNDFGATFGGPIRKNKTFFFLSYEGFRSRAGESGEALLPSPGQWNGDLADNSAGTGVFPTNSAFCQANPGSGKCVNVINPSSGQPFPGNIIPTSMLNARALLWHPFSPTPNVASAVNSVATPAFNYTATPTILNDFNDINVRVDNNLGNKDTLYGSYSYDGVPHIVPSVMPVQGTTYPFRGQVASLTENHVFSPTIVNDFRFGYNRGKSYLQSQGAFGPNYAAQFGYTNTSANPFDFGVPQAGISGYQTIGSFPESIGSIDQDFQFTDNLNIIRGTHNLKFGADVMRERFFQITDFAGIPSFSFTGQFTGSGLGDMLLGIPFTADTSVGNSAQNLRATYTALYAEDDWRLRPSLTLNLGLRYEYQQTPWDTGNRTAWFNPAIGQQQYSILGQVRNGIMTPRYDDFAPRVGFAWSPSFSKNTVIRAAGGVFYATDYWNELQFEVIAPRYYSTQVVTSNPVTPTLSLNDLFPHVGPATTTSEPFSLDTIAKTPTVYQWNFDVQHKFNGWLLDLGYIGNRGDYLGQRENLDAASFDPTGTIPLAPREPYPQYSGILWNSNRGWSEYNGFVASVQKQISAGLSLQASYVFDKCIDLGNGDDEVAMANGNWNVYDSGNCDYAVPQRFVAGYTYMLPFGPGKHFLSGISGMGGKLLGGWQVSGITTFESGYYQDVRLPTNWMNIGPFTTNVPDKVGPTYSAQRTINNWFNINSFTFPGCPSYVPCANGDHIEGNAGRNQIESPGLNNWDIGIEKDTRINERFTTQFRAEFFDTFNHPQWGAPNSTLIPEEFGVISSLGAEGPRAIQVALKLLF